jgi:hypothetical protein
LPKLRVATKVFKYIVDELEDLETLYIETTLCVESGFTGVSFQDFQAFFSSL